jgi:acetyl-CoA carboxylase beta subunit
MLLRSLLLVKERNNVSQYKTDNKQDQPCVYCQRAVRKHAAMLYVPKQAFCYGSMPCVVTTHSNRMLHCAAAKRWHSAASMF